MSHTPEPWTGDSEWNLRQQSTGKILAAFNKDKDVDRAIVCVNACVGLSNPAEALRQLRLRDAECSILTQQLEGLNPAAYRECVAALKNIYGCQQERLGMDATKLNFERGCAHCEQQAKQALAHAQEV